MASLPPPSFFSLVLDTSATTLKISTEFVIKHLKNKIPKDQIIIYADGGYSWNLNISKIGENYYFDNGWTNVVKDAHFLFGDFVLFTLVGKYTFEMFVYDKNSCERCLPKKVKVGDDVHNVAANVDVVDDIDGDAAGDPFFISTISKPRRTNLRLPDEFVELAGIEDERSIMLKNLDGEEWRMVLRPEKVNHSERLYISSGWADFQQSNDLWEGDECVLKFIRSEGKILLAKVTKKKRPARQLQASGESSKTEVVKRKRGRELRAHSRDVDVESEDEYMEMVERLRGNDDDDKDEDSDEDEKDNDINADDYDDHNDHDGEDEDDGDIDGDPFFTPIITRFKYLRLPKEFVGLPGIHAGGTILLKNLKGEEWQLGVTLDKSFRQSERYLLSSGWLRFVRSNDISAGDECIFKFIRKEGKYCLAKVTKKQRRAWKPQPSGEILATEEGKRKRGRLAAAV